MEDSAFFRPPKQYTIPHAGPPPDDPLAYAALNSIADAVYCVDRAGCFTFVNAAFEAMTGYTLADLQGTPSTRLYVPEAEVLFTERRRQVYNDATVSPYVETVLLRKDGSRLPVELSISTRIQDGQIAERVGVLRDIQVRQQTETALRQSSERLALFFDAATELLTTDDPLAFLENLYDRLAPLLDLEIYVHFALAEDGTYLKLAGCRGLTQDQRAALHRLEFGQAVCGTVAQTCRPMIVADVQKSSDPLTEVIRLLGITAYACHPLLSGNELFGTLSFGTKAKPRFTNESVNLIRAFSNLVAIAIARKQAEKALQQANAELEQRVARRTAALKQAHDNLRHEMAERHRMQEAMFEQEKLAALGTLLANVAHELNNPLAVAMLQLNNLLEEMDSDMRVDNLETLRQAIERCESVVQSFLALARQQPPTRQAVALNVVIDDVLGLLEHPLEVDGITVNRRLNEQIPPVWADANQLHHVVANLITNARHALREVASPRCLTLTTTSDADHHQVVLEVIDNGPGIPEAVQRRIFDPFFTTKPLGEGSGLGLPLCRSIVEGHGGTIQINSQAGHGTTVHVTLPITASKGSSPETPPEPDAPAQAQGRAILLIDDEPGVRKALRRVLQRSGYDVTIAGNGQEGLAALEERSYAVILCDMRMPDLDGPGFYRELEQCYPHLVSRVAFITGDVLGPEAQTFFDRVDNARLEKPFNAQKVRRVIKRVLEAR